MRLIDLLQLIAYNLSRRKGRVVLTAIGVVIGTASVILLVSLAIGLQESANNSLGGIGDLTQISVSPSYDYGGGGGVYVEKVGGGGGGGGGGGSSSQQLLLTPARLEEIASIPGVVTVIPRDYLYGGGALQYGKLETYAGVMGIGTKDLSILEYQLDAGTLTLEKGTAVIGGWAAKNFYSTKPKPGEEMVTQAPDILGQTLKMTMYKWTEDGKEVRKTVSLKIVGILKEMRGETDSMCYITMEDLTAWNEWYSGTRINRNKDGYSMAIVKADSVDNVLDIAQQINDMGFMASTPQEYVQGINSYFTVLQIVFGGIGAISLLVAAIGIANTMTMAILERTREIGLMKAVGATNRNVLTIFLGEAAGIGFVGGLGGVILGWGGGTILDIVIKTAMASQASSSGSISSMNIATPLWLPLFALVFATLVGLLSGLYPALRAATLVPVNALKYE